VEDAACRADGNGTTMMTFLMNTWPMFAAIGLVTLITIGATMPYIRKDRARRDHMEKDND